MVKKMIAIVNNNTKYPTEFLRQLIKFCEPPYLANRRVVFDFKHYFSKDRYHVKGEHGPFVLKHRVYNFNFIKIRIKRNPLPIIEKTKIRDDGYIDYTCLDEYEYLVSIVSHELFHQLQDDIFEGVSTQAKKYALRFSSGMSIILPDIDEFQADQYAMQKVREWRRFQNESVIYFPKCMISYCEKV